MVMPDKSRYVYLYLPSAADKARGGMLAARDFNLYAPDDWFGVTLTCDNDTDSIRNEPRAALWSDRIAALKVAHDR